MIMRFHIFFHGVSFLQAWAHFGCFLGSPGRPLGATGHPLKPQLGHFADSWCPGRPLGSLLGPIWCSVGWLCALLGALWCKSGHQLDDFVFLGVKFGFFWVSGLWITPFVLSLEATGWVCGYWFSRFRSRLNYILNGWMLYFTFLMVEYIVDNLFVSRMHVRVTCTRVWGMDGPFVFSVSVGMTSKHMVL